MSKKILIGKRLIRIGRPRLLFAYYSLVLKSFYHYRVSKRGNLSTVSCKFLDFEMCFQNFAVLISLIEEIFIDEIYAFHSAVPNPSIVDCGSNIGISLMYFKYLYPDASIIAFEPDPDAFSLLQRNVLLNGLSDVALMKLGLSNSPGEQLLYKDVTRPLNASLVGGNSGSSVAVNVARLSDYINGPTELVKVDVEGSEASIIEDLIQSERIQNVGAMIIEFHPEKVSSSLDCIINSIEKNRMKVSIRKAGRTETLLYCTRTAM